MLLLQLLLIACVSDGVEIRQGAVQIVIGGAEASSIPPLMFCKPFGIRIWLGNESLGRSALDIEYRDVARYRLTSLLNVSYLDSSGSDDSGAPLVA